MSKFPFLWWHKVVTKVGIMSFREIAKESFDWVWLPPTIVGGSGTKTQTGLKPFVTSNGWLGWPSKLMAVVFLSGGDARWKGATFALSCLQGDMLLFSIYVSCCFITFTPSGAFFLLSLMTRCVTFLVSFVHIVLKDIIYCEIHNVILVLYTCFLWQGSLVEP